MKDAKKRRPFKIRIVTWTDKNGKKRIAMVGKNF